MPTFAKFGGDCKYSDDAHSIGAISRISVVFCILRLYRALGVL